MARALAEDQNSECVRLLLCKGMALLGVSVQLCLYQLVIVL